MQDSCGPDLKVINYPEAMNRMWLSEGILQMVKLLLPYTGY